MYLREDSITGIGNINRDLAIYEIKISSSYNGSKEINFNQYLVEWSILLLEY